MMIEEDGYTPLAEEAPVLPSSYQEKQFTEDDEEVISYLNSAWDTAGGYYNYTNSTTELVLNFYNGQIPEEYRTIQNPLTGEMIETFYSHARIGWTKRAITQMRDEVVSSIISGNEFITIAPTYGTENVVTVCEKLMTVLLYNAGIHNFLDEIIVTWLLFGEAGAYLDWADHEQYCFSLQRIPYKDIRHLPAHLHPEKATLSYVQYLTKYELLDTPDGTYFNVDKLPEPDGNQLPRHNAGSEEGPSSDELRVVTSYIPEVTIGGKTYLNSVAVIADKTTLIQWRTGLPLEEFIARPHIRACREHFVSATWGPVQIGQSIAHQAIDLELAGFVIHNLMLDNAKQVVHPPRGVDPQDVGFKAYLQANPVTAFLPAALIPLVSNNPMHLQPIIGKDNMLQEGMAILQRLEQQYLMTIGIPDFGGGVASDDQRVAATTRTIQANRAAVRMKALVQDANRQLMLPIAYRAYKLVAEGYNNGNLHELAQQVCPIEHQLAQENGEIAPDLKPERFKMAVYESPNVRSERLQALQQMLSTLPTLLQVYPTLLQEAGIEIPRLVRQMMRDLGVEPSMPLTPPVLQQQPTQQEPMNGNPEMAGEPGNPLPSPVPTAGGEQPSGLPLGFPLPSGI